MGLRFGRSIKLAPGLRMNFSTRGVSLSAGPRGASINVSSRGVYGNVGIPGTGISYRGKLGGGGHSSPGGSYAQGEPPSSQMTVGISLQDDGTVQFLDSEGNPLPPRIVRQMKEQHGDRMQQWLEERLDHWNRGIEEILNLHLQTPAPDAALPAIAIAFTQPEPQTPVPEALTWWMRWFRKSREAVEQRNREREAEHEIARQQWLNARAEHQRNQEQRLAVRRRSDQGDPDAMQQVLEEVFGNLEWPRETNISFEIPADGRTVALDVDLPEIEDMPRQSASVAARGYKINIKEKSDAQVRREYATHIHAVGFRLVGEVFRALPAADTVLLSAYSQRPNRATAQVDDEYLYSVRVPRSSWSQIDFANLGALDLVACFDRFELRRNMTKTGMFTPVDPLSLT